LLSPFKQSKSTSDERNEFWLHHNEIVQRALDSPRLSSIRETLVDSQRPVGSADPGQEGQSRLLERCFLSNEQKAEYRQLLA
jgi:hypothetical protein